MVQFSRREAIGAVAASAIAAAAAATTKADDGGDTGTDYSIADFVKLPQSKEIRAVLSKLNGGSFMDCHTRIREETGVWIPELVPVFQKLDSMLLFKDAPAA